MLFDETMKNLLAQAKSIAIVGAKDKEGQPVDRVGRFLIERGLKVIPIHPVRKEVWGIDTLSSLSELKEHVDIICLFRASQHCLEHAKEVLQLPFKPKVFWMQEGIFNNEAGKLMFDAGLFVAEDLCIKTEYERLFPVSKEPLFHCTQCGVCCEGHGGIVVSNKDLKRLLEYFSVDTDAFDEKYTLQRNKKRVLKSGGDNYCLFYDKQKGCTIHEARPDVCRAWPYFRGNLLDKVSFSLAKEDCSGIATEAKHEEFMKEGYCYLKENSLIANKNDISAGNAVIFSEEDKIQLEKAGRTEKI